MKNQVEMKWKPGLRRGWGLRKGFCTVGGLRTTISLMI